MAIQLPHLKTLRVAANRIRHIYTNIGLWTKMQHLQLGSVFGGNLLTCIPDQIADMRRLEELDLSHNRLRVLPINMHIPSLVHLNVSDNQLATLPKSIASCAKLRTLNVSKNHLATLPADLVQLTQLELFDLSENLLCIMPADILERMRTTLLITGNPLTHPGHCDLANNDAYAQIVRQMTLRAYSLNGLILQQPQPQRHRKHHPHSHSHHHHSHFHLFAEGYDDDAGIDRELSYHARQLNIRGSRPGTPKALVGTITPPRSSDEEPEAHSPTDEHNLIHSLREIATRTILKHKVKVPLPYLSPHLAEDLSSRYRYCVACQEPFVHEWVTSVQVKSYKGHPAVVRRVRFCSTACWRSCL
ncbi:hypothetical protein BDA99DRAFT_424489, partial [Phascolomyces articulosus]